MIVTHISLHTPRINQTKMDKKNFAFGKKNFIFLAISMAVVILGFLLMLGGSSSVEQYNPDIFSVRRIKVAPVICFLGFIMMIGAVLYKPKDDEDEK